MELLEQIFDHGSAWRASSSSCLRGFGPAGVRRDEREIDFGSVVEGKKSSLLARSAASRRDAWRAISLTLP